MKHKATSGIYVIKNLAEGHNYVGSSVRVCARMDGHKSRLEKGKHHSKNLQEDWNRLGSHNFLFEVLEEVDLVLLQERENFWIEELKGLERYNSCRAGGRRDMRYHELQSFCTDVGTVHVGQGVFMTGLQWEIEEIYKFKGMACAVLITGNRKETIRGIHHKAPFTPMETQ